MGYNPNPNPITLQTDTYAAMGGAATDLQNTIAYAIALGARCVELPAGYSVLTATQLAAYNPNLAANDVSRALPGSVAPVAGAAFTGKLGTSDSMLGNIVLGTPRGIVQYTSATVETIVATADTVWRGLVLLRGISEAAPPAFDIPSGVALHTYVRNTLEVIPQATDSVQMISPTSASTFLALSPLPIYGVVYDSAMNQVGSIPSLLTRPVFKSAINGGFQPVTLDLPSSNLLLQNGFIVQLFEGSSPLTGEKGDGSVIYQGVIENLPDTYSTDPNHQVTLSPMVIFLGSTSYTASWTGVDVAVIVRDIVSQCPYLKFAPQSIQNISNQGNLISAENASFEGGTTGTWAVGTESAMLGTALAQPGLINLGTANDGNAILTNAGRAAGSTSGVLGVGLPGAFQLGVVAGVTNQIPGTDGTQAMQVLFTSSGPLANPRAALHLDGIPVAPGGTYTALASFLPVTTVRSVAMEIEWQDVNGFPISNVTGTAITEQNYTSVQPFVTAAAPAAAIRARIYPVITGAIAGEAHIIDQVSMAANISTVWTPGYTPGSKGTATLNFDHVSALQALTTCIQAAGPYYYFFVDEVGLVWLSRLDPSLTPTFQLSQGAQFALRDFSAPIDTLCNFIEIIGGNQLFDIVTTTTTNIPNTPDVSLVANSIFNVALWNGPPGLFTVQIDTEQMQVRAYGDLETIGPGDRSVQIYQRGYAGTTVAAHTAGAVVNVLNLPPDTVPITTFYDGTNGNPKRELIPPGTFSDCYDAPTLQQIANTMGVWLNRKVIATQLTLPDLGKKVRLNVQVGTTVSYWEPAVNPMAESYVGTGLPSAPLLVTDVEIDGGVQTIMLSDLPFTSQDLQYFVDNMLQNSMVVAAGAVSASTQTTPTTQTGVVF